MRQEVGGGSQVCFVKTETYLEAAILDSDSGGGEGVSCFYTNCSGRLKLDTSQFFRCDSISRSRDASETDC